MNKRVKGQHELRVKELGYKVKVTKTIVEIRFDDGDLYTSFKLVKDKDDNIYYIYNEGELINEQIDFYNTYENSIESCFYYFLTRF